MDEPFSALDPLTRRSLRTALYEMKKELAIPIVHVTHDIKEALFLGDEIIPVVKGKVFHKWLLQFMLTPGDMSLCQDRSGMDTEGDVELEAYDKRREYIR